MAVYSTINTVRTQMESADARFWQIFDSNENIIAECNISTTQNETALQAFNRLKEILDECTGDYVKVVIRKKPANKDEEGNFKAGVTKGQATYKYNIALTSPSGGGPIAGAGDSRGLLDQIYELKQQLRDQEHDQRYAELEKKIEGLTAAKSENGILDKFISRIADNVADRLTSSEIKKALSKDEPEPTEPSNSVAAVESNPEQERNIVVEFLKTTGAVMGNEKDTLAAIQALTHLAKTKPGVFKETAEQLIEQSNG